MAVSPVIIPSLKEGKWPDNVGIIAIEVYFPSLCVNHTHLETHDGASTGKYTIGLGQQHMGFCTDSEDVHSLSLTVVHNLMERNNVSFSDIGWLEVGTETILDKSKSVKTVLMQLFSSCGNTSIEGVDTTNACFGGTQALFNAVSWVESSSWDGRFALVVTADIAVYASGNARPTGGAGAVAMLIGPHAPLVMERGLKAIHMEHVYDFYKPDLSSEYPIVDGKLSIRCYLNALDQCYKSYGEKVTKQTGKPFTIEDGDYYVFHSPFTRLVQKSLARLVLQDYFNDITNKEKYSAFKPLEGRSLEDTLCDKEIEKLSLKVSESVYKDKTEPSVLLGKQVGNMYTASLYGGLASLLVNKKISDLVGKRVVLFSYGSGLASSMYSFRFTSDAMPTSPLVSMVTSVEDVDSRLRSRREVPPGEFEEIMKLREGTHHKAPYTPSAIDTSTLFPGTYYIEHIDEKHRRTYKRTPGTPTIAQNKLLPPIRLAAVTCNHVV